VGRVALLVIALGVQAAGRAWPAAELVVAALLVLLGMMVIWRYVRGRWHMHAHTHTAGCPTFSLAQSRRRSKHGHAQRDRRWRGVSLGFGMRTDMAGVRHCRAARRAVPDSMSRLVYFAAFSAERIVGMLAVSLTLSVLVRFARSEVRGRRSSTSAPAVMSGCRLVPLGRQKQCDHALVENH